MSMPFYATTLYAILCHTMPFYAILCHDILCHSTYATPLYAILSGMIGAAHISAGRGEDKILRGGAGQR